MLPVLHGRVQHRADGRHDGDEAAGGHSSHPEGRGLLTDMEHNPHLPRHTPVQPALPTHKEGSPQGSK